MQPEGKWLKVGEMPGRVRTSAKRRRKEVLKEALNLSTSHEVPSQMVFACSSNLSFVCQVLTLLSIQCYLYLI
jgi:hypothetical protein